jgi:Phage integrase family
VRNGASAEPQHPLGGTAVSPLPSLAGRVQETAATCSSGSGTQYVCPVPHPQHPTQVARILRTNRTSPHLCTNRTMQLSRSLRLAALNRRPAGGVICRAVVWDSRQLWHEEHASRHARYTPSSSERGPMLDSLRPSYELVLGVLAANSGCRSYEIRTLRFRDVDLKSRTLSIAASRSKNRHPRIVMLNDYAAWAVERAQLCGCRCSDDSILPRTSGGTHAASHFSRTPPRPVGSVLGRASPKRQVCLDCAFTTSGTHTTRGE